MFIDRYQDPNKGYNRTNYLVSWRLHVCWRLDDYLLATELDSHGLFLFSWELDSHYGVSHKRHDAYNRSDAYEASETGLLWGVSETGLSSAGVCDLSFVAS